MLARHAIGSTERRHQIGITGWGHILKRCALNPQSSEAFRFLTCWGFAAVCNELVCSPCTFERP